MMMRLMLLLSLVLVCYCYQNICIGTKKNINNRITYNSNSNDNANDNSNSIKTINDDVKDNIKITLTTPLLLGLGSLSSSLKSNADDRNYDKKDSVYNSPLPADAYTTLGNMNMCKIINGMWQVSGIITITIIIVIIIILIFIIIGAHGYQPNKELVVSSMSKHADKGFTTFDLADIYGPAESYVGAFNKGPAASSQAKDCQFFTKWVPRPQEITQKKVDAAIDKSLLAMGTEQLDLLQFHWWDYDNKYYYDAMGGLMKLHDQEKIKNIGLCNFDTEHMLDLINEKAPIVSNQVSFSILDTRPLEKMVPASLEHNVKLLTYGGLLGGFISSYWKGKPEPIYDSLTNVSLRKYLPWIQYWGGWRLFQELLTVLDKIAIKHSVSISNVAIRWVLDQPAVGGVIVGVRFGLSDHIRDNVQTFNLKLDDEDINAIKVVQGKGNKLYTIFGDTGNEYHRRSG